MRNVTRNLLWALMAFTVVEVLPVARGADATALELVKEGNRYIGEQAKDKVVQIRSEKSVGGIMPNIWYVVYYDPTAAFKAVEVKFGAGKMLDVKRPMRLLEPVTRGQEPLDMSKVRIDSDKAIKTALSEPLLERLTVKATSAKLGRGEGGLPVWTIRIWAAKIHDPKELADLGEVVLSAEDAKVIKNGLRINKAE